MLWFERQVVEHLLRPDLDERSRAEVEHYVDSALRVMPEHLRAGVALESLAFGAWPSLQRAVGRLDPTTVDRAVERCRTSRIDVVRQYIRLLESLVLFAENELVPVRTS
jgi:hypothetical protein